MSTVPATDVTKLPLSIAPEKSAKAKTDTKAKKTPPRVRPKSKRKHNKKVAKPATKSPAAKKPSNPHTPPPSLSTRLTSKSPRTIAIMLRVDKDELQKIRADAKKIGARSMNAFGRLRLGLK